MGYCPVCGGKTEDGAEVCPHCGADLPAAKDDWAEKLQPHRKTEAAPEPAEELPPEEDWLQEVEEAELEPLSGDYGPDAPPVKAELPKMTGVQWVLRAAVFLAAVLVLSVLYLRYRRQVTPTVGSGTYYGYTRTREGETRANSRDWVRLYPSGKLEMELMGSRIGGQWQLDRTWFYAHLDHKNVQGTLENGVLTFAEGEFQYVFTRDGREYTEPAEALPPVTVPEVPDPYADWQGDYYGVMVYSDCTGGFADYEGLYADVCGRILVGEGGTGTLEFWNGDNRPGDRFCMADVLFADGTTEQGRMFPQWGKFYGTELRYGEWVVDPGKSPVSHLEDLYYLRGRFLDGSSPDSGFSYEIYFKAWGEDWQQIALLPVEALPGNLMLPPGYGEWYLPLIRAGQRMPDHF